jgi:desulfoferrodoxin (superoxide reductase-like protein)
MNVILDTDYKLDDVSFIKYLKEINSPFLPKIIDVYNDIKDVLNTRIPSIFKNYTLHNTGHSFRIMEYMSKFVGDIKQLNELEITILIYSALLHDIGMAVSEEDVELIKTDSFSFCDVKFSTMKKIMNADDETVLREYIRRIHSSLSARYIKNVLKENFSIPKLVTLDFSTDLALICESHTKDYDWIKKNLRSYEVRGDYYFNSQFIACILRLSDILDIDGNRTPFNLYKLIAPTGISEEEWKQHFVISNNDKIVFNDKTKQKKVVFHGRCTSASIHRKILTYIGWVKNELVNSTSLLNSMLPPYNLIFDTNPEINIQTEGYTFSDQKMTLDFKAISSLLMGEKIYGKKSLGLRELIQNSIDACRIRQETRDKETEFGEEKYIPKIKVIVDQEKEQVIIKDNGIGMSLDIIKKHFLNIGVSFYNSPDFLLQDYNYKPIGNFGIGFLSCFMLSENVKVETRHYLSSIRYTIDLEIGDEWTSLKETEDVMFEGTEVILNYDNFLSVFDNKIEAIKEFLNSYFLTDNIEFQLVIKEEKKLESINNPLFLNSASEQNFIKINFPNYLEDFDGYALIKPKKNFITKFEDLNFGGDVYTYSDEGKFKLVEDFDDLSIDDFINNNEIRYMHIPLVNSSYEDDFNTGIKFTDGDVSEVISKMEHELEWISILVTKDNQEELENEIIDYGDKIYGDFNFDNLVELGHCIACKTMVNVETIKLFEGEKNNLYLPFSKANRYSFYYYWGSARKKMELYVRSILIRDFHFKLPITASIFDVDTIRININSRKFVPDISRNNLDEATTNLINYLVGKVIHRGAYDLLNLNPNESNTLKNFIDIFYRQKNEFEI